MKDELIKMIQNALSGRISFLFAELCDDIEDYAGDEDEDVGIQECKDSFGRESWLLQWMLITRLSRKLNETPQTNS